MVRFVLISDFGFRFWDYCIGRLENMAQRSKQGVGILLSICIWIKTRKCRNFTLTFVIDHSEDRAGWRLMDDWEDADDLFVWCEWNDSIIREDLHSASRFLVL